MTPCLLLFPNQGDKAVLSGGQYQIPLANLQDRILQRVARTANRNLLSTQMVIELDRSRPTRGVVLVDSSIAAAGRKRVRLLSADDSVLAQTGTPASNGWEDVFPRELPTRLMRWTDRNFWSGRTDDEKLKGSTVSTITLFDGEYFAKRITIEIDDQAIPFDAVGRAIDYLDFGRLFVAGQYQPSHNYTFGAALSFDARTTSKRSRGGTLFSNRLRHPRIKTIAFEGLPEAEVMSQIYEMQRQAGTDGELFYVQNPADIPNLQRTSFLARMRTLPAIVESEPGRCDVSFDIEEII